MGLGAARDAATVPGGLRCLGVLQCPDNLQVGSTPLSYGRSRTEGRFALEAEAAIFARVDEGQPPHRRDSRAVQLGS